MKRINILLISLLTLGAIICSSDFELKILDQFEKGDSKTLFIVFHYRFKKEYDLNSEEAIRRYRVFKSNLNYIKEQNKKGLTYTFGVNHLADFTFEELNKMYLNTKDGEIDRMFHEIEKQSPKGFTDTPPENRHEIRISKEKINNFFDAEDYDEDELKILQVKQSVRVPLNWTYTFLPARNQRQCGSCWAFAVSGSMEANYYIKYPCAGKFYLSPQQLVDCDTNNGSACNGGWTLGSMYYYCNNVGLVKDSVYPYFSGTTQAAGICKSSTVTSSLKIKNSWTNYCTDCTIDQYYSALTAGPIVISSYVTNDWYFYRTQFLLVTMLILIML